MKHDMQECLKILDEAVEFEETGMNLYLKRAESAGGELESSLFRSLAADETRHKAYLLELKAQLLASGDPQKMRPPSGAEHRSARRIFEAALAKAADPYSAEPQALKIIAGALEVERRGFAMYTEAAAAVQSPRAKEIFRELAHQEQEHFSLLKNTYDYLADPEGWHGFDESPMLDGG